MVIFQRRHNNVKALTVQLFYIVLQFVGRKTAHGHTAIFGDIALGQGQVKGRRRAFCVLAFKPSVQFKEVAHLIQHQTVGVMLLDGVVGVPKPAAGRPRLRLWGGAALRRFCLFADSLTQNGDDLTVFVVLIEKIQHTAVTVPNVLTLGECPPIGHNKGKFHLVIA